MLFYILVSCFVLFSQSSGSGDYYTCGDSQPGYCPFVASEDAPEAWNGVAQGHDLSYMTDPNYHTDNPEKQVYNTQTNTRTMLSARPWAQGEELMPFEDGTIMGEEWNYVLAFEMIAPIRNIFMYDPKTLVEDDAQWAFYTQVFDDCGIKMTTEGTQFSTADMRSVMATSRRRRLGAGGGPPTDTETGTADGEGPPPDSGTDIVTTWIMQYLEEATVDLVCLMSDLSSEMQHRCEDIRADNAEGTACTNDMMQIDKKYSACWVGAYQNMFNFVPETDSDWVTCSDGSSVTLTATDAVHPATNEEAGGRDGGRMTVGETNGSTQEVFPIWGIVVISLAGIIIVVLSVLLYRQRIGKHAMSEVELPHSDMDLRTSVRVQNLKLTSI